MTGPKCNLITIRVCVCVCACRQWWGPVQTSPSIFLWRQHHSGGDTSVFPSLLIKRKKPAAAHRTEILASLWGTLHPLLWGEQHTWHFRWKTINNGCQWKPCNELVPPPSPISSPTRDAEPEQVAAEEDEWMKVKSSERVLNPWNLGMVHILSTSTFSHLRSDPDTRIWISADSDTCPIPELCWF